MVVTWSLDMAPCSLLKVPKVGFTSRFPPSQVLPLCRAEGLSVYQFRVYLSKAEWCTVYGLEFTGEAGGEVSSLWREVGFWV